MHWPCSCREALPDRTPITTFVKCAHWLQLADSPTCREYIIRVSRWRMTVHPSLSGSWPDFRDDDVGAEWLARRWPEAFVCQTCGARRGWELDAKSWTRECTERGRQDVGATLTKSCSEGSEITDRRMRPARPPLRAFHRPVGDRKLYRA